MLEVFFEVKNIDPDGKKFDKVSRIVCTSENSELDLILDVNTDIYPIEIEDRLIISLARHLESDSKVEDGYYDPTARYPEMDKYDYVTYGKLYDYKPEKNKVSIYVSFGGLLMKLTGVPSIIDSIIPKAESDINLYLLMRKSR